MTRPGQDDITRVLDATWPPARFVPVGPWCLREGDGGGQRVSAASAISPVSETDIPAAETGMRDLGQEPLFMIRPRDRELDGWLATRGYAIKDPVAVYLAPVSQFTATFPVTSSTPSWPPLASGLDIWRQAGIGPARIAVMHRGVRPVTTLLGRAGDTPAGVAYVGVMDDIAMLHALEVLPGHRRSGVGRALVHGAARWAAAHGALWLSLIVTRANAPANALYQSLGMVSLPGYHYRIRPGTAP